MTRIEVHNRVSDFNSYRAARVKSLFNAENGCNFDLEIDADLSGEWGIGVVVGPSGSGKTSIGRTIFGEDKIYDYGTISHGAFTEQSSYMEIWPHIVNELESTGGVVIAGPLEYSTVLEIHPAE